MKHKSLFVRCVISLALIVALGFGGYYISKNAGLEVTTITNNVLADSIASYTYGEQDASSTSKDGVGASIYLKDGTNGLGYYSTETFNDGTEIGGTAKDYDTATLPTETWQGIMGSEYITYTTFYNWLIEQSAEDGNFYANGGDGSGENPYTINSALQFTALSRLLSLCGNNTNNLSNCGLNGSGTNPTTIKFTEDIDLSGNIWLPLVSCNFGSTNGFVIDGDGKTIKNVYMNENYNAETFSIFGNISKATIQDLTIENAHLYMPDNTTYASFVANGYKAYNTNYNSTFINVSVNNSVLICNNLTTTSAVNYSGIAINATSFVGCSVNNSTIAVNVLPKTNQNGVCIVGIGYSNDIQNCTLNKSVIKIISQAEGLNNTNLYNRFYIYGIGASTTTAVNPVLQNLQVTNSVLATNTSFKSPNGTSDGSTTVDSSANTVSYDSQSIIVGVYRHDDNVKSTTVANLSVTNSTLEATNDYIQTMDTYQANVRPRFYNYLCGVFDLYGINTTDSTYASTIKNITTHNCTINSQNTATIVQQENSSLRDYEFCSYVSGAVNSWRTEDNIINAKVSNNKILVNQNINNTTTGSNYRTRVYSYIYGISKTQYGAPNYKDVEFVNNYVETVGHCINKDDANRSYDIYNYAYFYGIGKAVSVNKSENFVATEDKSYCNRVKNNNINLVLINEIGETSPSYFIGDAAVYGIGDASGQAQNYTVDSVEFSKNDVNIINEWSSSYFVGLSRVNSNNTKDATITNCLVDNNKIVVVGRIDALATTGVWHSDTIDSLTINNVIITNNRSTQISYRNIYSAGLLYSYGTVANTAQIKYCKIEANQIISESKYNSAVTTTQGDVFAVGAVFNRNYATYEIEKVQVINSAISAKSNISTAIAAGIFYNNNASTYAYNNIVKNCDLKESTVCSETTTGGLSGNQASFAYGIAGVFAREIQNCLNINSVVKAHSAQGHSLAVGVGTTWGYAYWQTVGTSNRPSSLIDDSYTGRIINCYNFSDVTASTGSPSHCGVSAGIGQAEYISECLNYGNIGGNIVGGITYGANGHNSEAVSYQLVVKNCINHGDVYKTTNGGTSYLGGIVGRYYMQYEKYRYIEITNCVANGNVYSDEQASQNVSSGCYLGILFGIIDVETSVWDNEQIVNITSSDVVDLVNLLDEENPNKGTAEWQTAVDNNLFTKALKQINITKNYYDGNKNTKLNNGLTNGYQGNTPITYCQRSKYGTLYLAYTALNAANFSENQIVIANVFDGNLDYSSAEFAGFADDYYVKNDVVEFNNSSLEYTIVIFDLNGNNGNKPNALVLVNDESGNINFTMPYKDGVLTDFGVEVAKWSQDAVDSSSGYTPGESINVTPDRMIYKFYAIARFTSFNIVVNGSDSGETVQLNSERLTLTTSPTGDVKAIEIYVVDKDGNNVKLVTSPKAEDPTIDLTPFLSSSFLETYVKDGKINFAVNYVTAQTYTIAFINKDGNPINYTISISGSASYTYEGTTGQLGQFVVLEDTDSTDTNKIVITTTPQFGYKFVEYTGDISSTSNTVTLETITQNYTITVNVDYIEYDLDVKLVNEQNAAIDSSYVNALVQDLSGTTITIAEAIPSLKANIGSSEFRFSSWRLNSMNSNETLPSANGVINDGYTLTPELFEANIINDKFTLVAVFQRQYVIKVNLINPLQVLNNDLYNSTYTIIYTDYNGVEQHIESKIQTQQTNSAGETETVIIDNPALVNGLSIDENTFVKIKLNINKRVQVDNYKLTYNGTELDLEFNVDTAYVYLTGNNEIEFNFAVKKLSLQREGLDGEGNSVASITSAINLLVNSNDVANVLLGDTLSIGYNSESLSSIKYRFISLQIYNVESGNYEPVTADTLNIDDDFYTNYANNNGEVKVRLVANKQFTFVLDSSSIISSDNYILGYYTLAIYDGDTLADNSKITINALNQSYTLDKGLVVKIVVNSNKYAHFEEFYGLIDGEGLNNTANILIDSDRSISLSFAKDVYKINASTESDGEFSSTKQISVGETVTLYFTPGGNNIIKDWKINGLSISDLGGKINGNTVSFVATKDVLDKLQQNGSLTNGTINLANNINTALKPVILYGIVGGGSAIVILALVVVILVLRALKLKKEKEEKDRIINDMSRKFNIGGAIKDLRNGGTGGL